MISDRTEKRAGMLDQIENLMIILDLTEKRVGILKQIKNPVVILNPTENPVTILGLVKNQVVLLSRVISHGSFLRRIRSNNPKFSSFVGWRSVPTILEMVGTLRLFNISFEFQFFCGISILRRYNKLGS